MNPINEKLADRKLFQMPTALECRDFARRMELWGELYAIPERVAKDLRNWAQRLEDAEF